MKYKILFLVSILIFVSLSIANVVLSTGRVQVGTPSCEVFTREGLRCATVFCAGSEIGGDCYDDQNNPTTLTQQSKNICERFTGCTILPEERLSCDLGNRSASYGKECNGVTTSITSGAISCPLSCTCPIPIGPKPCGNATWNSNTCDWNVNRCRNVGDDGGLECNQYCSSGELSNNGKGGNGDLPSPFPCCEVSPIVVDVDGDGFSLTSASDGVMFDFNGDGISHRISWTEADSDDAWLVLDRNANGTIDSSREMFGNMTEQPQSSEPHGFLALAEYDKIENGGNADRKINNLDSIFTDLRLWQDVNHNGQSEQNELFTLGSLSVRELDLKYKKSKKVDQNGNEFRYRAKVLDTHNSNISKWAWDVFLILDEAESYNSQVEQGDSNLKNVKFYR